MEIRRRTMEEGLFCRLSVTNEDLCEIENGRLEILLYDVNSVIGVTFT
jgi:hypothetical protein